MLALLLANWRLVAVGLAVAALAAFAAVQHTRLQWTQTEFAQFRAKVESEAAAAKVAAARQEARWATQAKEAIDALQTRYAALDVRYKRLRTIAGSDPVPALASAAPILGACPGDDSKRDSIARFLDQVEEGVIGILEQGDRAIIKHRELWGLSNKNAGVQEAR